MSHDYPKGIDVATLSPASSDIAPLRLFLDRRKFIVASAASYALASCTPQPPPPDSALPTRFIDVHCHVFSGKDVPAAKFVLHVVARESGFQDYAKAAAFFVNLLTLFSPTAAKERNYLNGMEQAAEQLDDPNVFQTQIYQTLEQLQREAAFPSANEAPSPLVVDLGLAQIPVQADTFQVDGVQLNPEGAALAYLMRRQGPANAPTLHLQQQQVQSTKPLSDLTTERLRDLAASLTAEASSPTSAFGSYLSFARSFISYRSTNIQRLDRALHLAVVRTASLYTPLLIDYDYWLDAHDTTPLPEQTALMALISRKTRPGVLANGFVPFDPLRAVVARHDAKRQPDHPHDIVQRAICAEGFVGVKVYPPMGFRAITNDGLTDFGPRANLLGTSLGLSPLQLGAELDDVLTELYRYCVANDIPILAHCSNSQASFSGSGIRAAPAYWQTLLSRPDRGVENAFRSLRLNLAHFGSVWCESGEPYDSKDEEQRCKAPTVVGWPRDIVETAVSFPNVYFDIADVGVLSKEKTSTLEITNYVDGLLGQDVHRKIASRKILYGTDWMFLTVAAAGSYTEFASGAARFADTLAIARDDLFAANAARFMGLTESGTTTKRLQEFYAGDEQRLDILKALVVPDDARAQPHHALSCGR